MTRSAFGQPALSPAACAASRRALRSRRIASGVDATALGSRFATRTAPTTLAATLVPAMDATRIDPLETIRVE
jgi:hypothetical protein